MLTYVGSPAQAGRKLRSRSEAIFSHALAVTGSPLEQNVPFTLRATLRFPGPDAETKADFELYWDSPEEWREECHLPGEDRVRVANVDRVWASPARDLVSIRLGDFRAALDYYDLLREMSHRKPVAGRSAEIGKQPVDCVTVETGDLGDCELCAEPDSGLPRILTCTGRTVALSGYERLDDRFFPGSLVVLEYGKPVVEARIAGLVLNRARDASLFTRPPDTEEWPWCAEAEPPKLFQTPPRDPLASFRGDPGDSVVTVHVVIDARGRIVQPTILSSHHPELEEAILRFLDGYRFIPSRCGKTKIPRESYFVFDPSQPSHRLLKEALQ